ncbi:MAG TPA: hypothetical protein VES20_18395, partial [Bryobacteraceae bacterium]|nr:hypothetical protein [Bryobacteraceae bacterium]
AMPGMSAGRVFTQVRDAMAHLNPKEVREEADRPFTIQLFAPTEQSWLAIESWFAPSTGTTPGRQAEVSAVVRRGADYAQGTVIRVFHEDLPHGPGDFTFRPADPGRVICVIFEANPALKLSLARRVAPFRPHVVKGIIRAVSRENAVFSLATAVPSVLPLVSLPWAIGEFASDTAFLTANQIRMAFMLAAASDRKIGYAEQKAEVASLFAGAFGWRAIARELAGKIPMGGGLIPKAAISFAGTWVIGASLERLYRAGYGYTPEERRAAYEQAFEQGKQIAAGLIRSVGGSRAAS